MSPVLSGGEDTHSFASIVWYGGHTQCRQYCLVGRTHECRQYRQAGRTHVSVASIVWWGGHSVASIVRRGGHTQCRQYREAGRTHSVLPVLSGGEDTRQCRQCRRTSFRHIPYTAISRFKVMSVLVRSVTCYLVSFTSTGANMSVLLYIGHTVNQMGLWVWDST